MSRAPIATNEEAKLLLDERDPLNSSEILALFRHLKRNHEDLETKLRMLKSEIGRLSRRP